MPLFKMKPKEIGIESVCPYCFEKVKANDIVFRALRGEEEVDGKLSAYSKKIGIDIDFSLKPVISQTDAGTTVIDKDKFNNAPIRVRHNTLGESSTKLCPYCHNDLPYKFGSVPLVNISLVGNTSVGKTVYMTELGNHIDNFISKETPLSSTPAGDETTFDILKDRISLLQDMILDANNTATYEKPFIFSVTDGFNTILLSVYDMAGESSTRVDKLGFEGLREQQIKNSTGIFLLLEPMDYVDENENVNNADDQNDGPIKTLTDLDASGLLDKSSVKIAAIIAKSDKLYEELHGKDKMYDIIFEDSTRYDESDIAKINAAAGAYFEHAENGNYTKLRNLMKDRDKKGREITYNNLYFFAVSSLGADPEGGMIQYKHSPKRVLEPLLWVLKETTSLNLIK